MGISSSTMMVKVEPPFGSSIYLNVKTDFGATGNGVTDDTAAIQAGLNAAAAGNFTLYFPPGTYMTNLLLLNGVGRFNLFGEGEASIIKRIAGASAIWTFTGCSDINVHNLSFDMNGIAQYGGVQFYGASRVRVFQCHFFDGNALPPGAFDRFSVIFAAGGGVNSDIDIFENIVENLQVTVTQGSRVRILDNTILSAVLTGGITSGSIGGNEVNEDYEVAGNIIIDPEHNGIYFVDEGPLPIAGNTMRRIHIHDNTIIKTPASGVAGSGVLVGVVSPSDDGNIYEDIVVENNMIQFSNDPDLEDAGVRFRLNPSVAYPNSDFFDRTVVRGNQISGFTKAWAIDVRYLRNSEVSDNLVTGSAYGIAVVQEILACTVARNKIHAGVAVVAGPYYAMEVEDTQTSVAGVGYTAVVDNTFYNVTAGDAWFSTNVGFDYYDRNLLDAAVVSPPP